MSEMNEKSVAALDPNTMRCVAVAISRPDNIQDLWDEGYILVPVTLETARRIYTQPVDDIAAIAIK